ncbi:hypothetical protein JOB18_015305 [Solea senegalensis]|uniref:Uncharacterized protein n=1 Tax=Solea senegalensis TaxID=28829 RepID=A0AAV6R2B3_SOLSE|nr:hypothetical protein JOB18_015305 [Solea senegalensis]
MLLWWDSLPASRRLSGQPKRTGLRRTSVEAGTRSAHTLPAQPEETMRQVVSRV